MPTDRMTIYRDLMADRPEKLDEAESGYREGTADHACRWCLHLFKRQIDGFTVCEIVRPTGGDSDNDTSTEAINPRWVCDYFTHDGDTFPLLRE